MIKAIHIVGRCKISEANLRIGICDLGLPTCLAPNAPHLTPVFSPTLTNQIQASPTQSNQKYKKSIVCLPVHPVSNPGHLRVHARVEIAKRTQNQNYTQKKRTSGYGLWIKPSFGDHYFPAAGGVVARATFYRSNPPAGVMAATTCKRANRSTTRALRKETWIAMNEIVTK
jgi:hypothetical protein